MRFLHIGMTMCMHMYMYMYMCMLLPIAGKGGECTCTKLLGTHTDLCTRLQMIYSIFTTFSSLFVTVPTLPVYCPKFVCMHAHAYVRRGEKNWDLIAHAFSNYSLQLGWIHAHYCHATEFIVHSSTHGKHT